MTSRSPKKEPAILAAVVAGIALLLASPFAVHWLRDPMAARAATLPLSFPHSKHVKNMQCTTCHHNLKDSLKDSTAGVPCIYCHKSNHPKLRRGIEGEFHDLCRGCHADRARWFEKHGPIANCAGCHSETTDGKMP